MGMGTNAYYNMQWPTTSVLAKLWHGHKVKHHMTMPTYHISSDCNC